MNLFLFNIVLAVGWCVLTDDFTFPNVVLGFALSYGALLLARKAFRDATYFSKLPYAVGLAAFVLWELLHSSLLLARDVLTPKDYSRPRMLAVPLHAKTDAEITMLANCISLTPGTVSAEVSEDRSILYVHCLYAYDEEEVIRSIHARLEARILRLMRPSYRYEPAATKTPGGPR